MTRYADPLRCPDCSSPIGYGTATCPRCGLLLRGDLAQELFVTLGRADSLLAALRAASAAPAPAAATVTPTGTPPPAPVRHRLSGASVPKILLGLGAACLLVAALVFLAYTWSVLGVAGRTAVLLGFTVLAGGLAAWGAGRGLRAVAESLTLVALGLLALDTLGARSAGWLGDIDTSAFLLVLGLVLGSAAVASALLVRRTPARALAGAELVVALATALVGIGIATLSGLPASPALVLAVLTGAATTAGTRWRRLGLACAGAAVVTGVEWLVLLGSSLERVTAHPSLTAAWIDLQVWPLLVTAALVGALCLLRQLPRPVRVLALAACCALLAVAALAPVFDESPTAVLAALLVVLAVAAGPTWAAPRPWGLAASLTQAFAGAAVLVVAVPLVLAAVTRLGSAALPVWSGGAGDRLASWPHAGLPDAWLLPLCVVALVGTAASLGRAVPSLGRRLRSLVDVPALAVLALVTCATTVALYPVLLGVPVALLVLGGLACAVGWLATRRPLLLVAALLTVAAGTGVALHAQVLTAAALVIAAAGAGLVHLRARSVEVAEGAGLLLALTLAALTWTGGALLDTSRPWVALAGLLVLGVVALAAPAAPQRWWAVPAGSAHVGLEVGAAAASAPVAAAGVLLAGAGTGAAWAAVYLTVAGVVVVAMALLRDDRRLLGWPGGALLALASWVRLWDLGVREPEAYTLPAAAALLVVGVVHLRRHPRAGTLGALSSGLGLALLPTLLWALEDPISLRTLLLGLGCFGLLVAGVRVRWTAPVLWGASVGLVVVVRLAAPYIGEAVPRWLLIGLAGTALIAMGVTWERRLADARHVVSYVRSLR